MRMRIKTINNTKLFECSSCGVEKEIDNDTIKFLKLKTKIPHPEEKLEIVTTAEFKKWESYMNDVSLKIKDGSLEVREKNHMQGRKYINRDIKPSQTRIKKSSQTKNKLYVKNPNAKSLNIGNQNEIDIGRNRFIIKKNDSAIKKEIQRTAKILGKNYKDYYFTEIKEREKKYLVFQLYGKHEFNTRSKYGDRKYTAFTVNKEIKEPVIVFLPEVIERKKNGVIERELAQHIGERFHYISPAGRHISRIIKPTKKDFKITIKSLLSVVEPQKNIVRSSLKENIQRNLLMVNDTKKMCVKCTSIFRPISWSGWEDKYLSTSQVYVCENCNPNLKRIISNERIDRKNYEVSIKNLKSRKAKFGNLSFVDLPIILLIFLFGIGFSSLILIPIPVLISFFIFFRFKIKSVSKTIEETYTKESNRQKMVLNSVDNFKGI